MTIDVLISYSNADSGDVDDVTNIIYAECPDATVHTNEGDLAAAVTAAKTNYYDIICRISDGLTDAINDDDTDVVPVSIIEDVK